MQQSGLPMSLIEQGSKRSEVMTAMRERFTVMELAALRNDLLQGGMIDSRDAAELLQVFLMGRGSLPVLQRELEGLALVM